MLETVEAWIGFVLVLIFFGTCLAWFLMWYGAGLARIQKSGFWRSLGASLFASVVVYLVTLAALVYGPPVKTVYGLAVGFILALVVIKVSYLTSFLNAFVPWLFFLVAQAIVILAATEFLIGDLADLIEVIH